MLQDSELLLLMSSSAKPSRRASRASAASKAASAYRASRRGSAAGLPGARRRDGRRRHRKKKLPEAPPAPPQRLGDGGGDDASFSSEDSYTRERRSRLHGGDSDSGEGEADAAGLRRFNSGIARRSRHRRDSATLLAKHKITGGRGARPPVLPAPKKVDPAAERMKLDLVRVMAHGGGSRGGRVAHSPIHALGGSPRRKPGLTRRTELSSMQRTLAMTTPRSPRPQPMDAAMRRRMKHALIHKYNSTSPLVTHNGFRADRQSKIARAMRHRAHEERSKGIRAQNELARTMAGQGSGGTLSLPHLQGASPIGRRGLLGSQSHATLAGSDTQSYSMLTSRSMMSGSSRVTSLPPVPSSMVSPSEYRRSEQWRKTHHMKDPGFIKRAKARGTTTMGATVYSPSSITLKSTVNSKAGFVSRSPRKTLEGHITPRKRRATRLHADSLLHSYSSFASARELKHHRYGFSESRRL